jgi:hypothetical protein
VYQRRSFLFSFSSYLPFFFFGEIEECKQLFHPNSSYCIHIMDTGLPILVIVNAIVVVL